MPPDQYPDDARRMLDLIARFSDRLPPDRLECMNEWVVQREWVMAFEILCDEARGVRPGFRYPGSLATITSLGPSAFRS